MATSSEQLEKLIKMRTGYEYTPKTAEQIRQQAEGEYQSYYDQLRLAARQAQQSSDLRLQQQITGLQSTYDQQREDSARQFRQAYSQADRQLIGRGMQRSSYGAQTLANVNLEGNRAQQKINDAQAAATQQIEDQRTQLQNQLSEKINQYAASQAADVMNRERQLEDTEYQRRVDALKSQTSLEQAIYSAMYQQERDKKADEQWQKQFDESTRQFNQNFALESFRYGYNQPQATGGGGGGGDSYSSGGGYNPSKSNTDNKVGSIFALANGGNKSSIPVTTYTATKSSGNIGPATYKVGNPTSIKAASASSNSNKATFTGLKNKK